MYINALLKRGGIFAGHFETEKCKTCFEKALAIDANCTDVFIHRARVSIVDQTNHLLQRVKVYPYPINHLLPFPFLPLFLLTPFLFLPSLSTSFSFTLSSSSFLPFFFPPPFPRLPLLPIFFPLLSSSLPPLPSSLSSTSLSLLPPLSLLSSPSLLFPTPLPLLLPHLPPPILPPFPSLLPITPPPAPPFPSSPPLPLSHSFPPRLA